MTGACQNTHSNVSLLTICHVVVSSSRQSPSLGVSLFRTALSITILLSVLLASKGSRKGVVVMRRMTAVETMVARCRVCSIHALTKDSAVTGAQLCQYSSCLPWQCLFGCSNGRRSAIRQF